MSAVEVKLKSEISAQIWCKVQIRNGEDLLIGVCYRTPNERISQKDNNKFLCDMIAELHGKPLLLMGDFNFPNVDWSTSHGPTPASQSFVDSIEDGYLTQHVNEGTCNGAVLDLVRTSEPCHPSITVDVVSVLGRFGSSDHNILQWGVKLNPVFSLFNKST